MKLSGLFWSVCLLVWAEQELAYGHVVTETLGDLTFQCEHGWKNYKANCYTAINVTMTFDAAAATCKGQGGWLYYAENEIEYFDFVAGLLTETIWIDLVKSGGWKIRGAEVPLEFISGWGMHQPNELLGNHTIISVHKKLRIEDGKKHHPFVCKHRACMAGYMRCDRSSKCVQSERVCDGLPDCLDRSDERKCPNQCTQYNRLRQTNGSFSTGLINDTMDCTWVYEAPVNKMIRLHIPAMTLEENVAFIEVWTGGPTLDSSRRIQQFTGTVESVYLYSDYNFFIIRIYAKDVSLEAGPYTFEWSTDIQEIHDGVDVLDASNSWQTLIIPFSTLEYKPKDVFLYWHIDAEEGELITFYLKINPHSGYEEDDVKFDIRAGEVEPIEYRHYYTTAMNELHVSSYQVPENGEVILQYRIGCGLNIIANYGVIESPHPVIPNSVTCTWTLTGRSVSRGMVLKFISINLMSDPRKTPSVESMDTFKIYIDDVATPVTEVVQYDDSVDNVIHAAGGEFRIEFMSDAALTSEGFTIGFGTDCIPLDLSEETIMSTNSSFYKENVELSCPIGHKFHLEEFMDKEMVILRCDEMVWQIDGTKAGAIPECQIAYCGAPTKIENGAIANATGVIYGSVATYKCKPEFDMYGGENATCDMNGHWIHVPTCQFFRCTALLASFLPNGMFEIFGNNFTNNNADFEIVVKFSCELGYELIGPTISQCHGDGWTHEGNSPTCTKLACPLPYVPNSDSRQTMLMHPILFENTYTVKCNDGYRFTSGHTGDVTLTCQANQTFDQELECEDIDECTEDSHNCNAASTCMNNDGSYTCDCHTGFQRQNAHTCTDILECGDHNGGCSDKCVERQGSYDCDCEQDGYELYKEDGFYGFSVPTSETGFMYGDIFRVDHTCVPIPCPTLETVANGMYLSKSLNSFHVEDTVTLQCMDGYRVNKTGTTLTSIDSICQSVGSWDQLYSCIARKCPIPSSTPTHGEFDKEEVMFEDTLTLTCNLTETTKQVQHTVWCIYENGDVHLDGEDISACPEIDCGTPVLPGGGDATDINPTTTTYFGADSSFTFKCLSGFDVTGLTTDSVSSKIVRCMDNGRWDFGTLACTGKMCTDPGTPGDAQQNVNGYEVGSVLYYSCNKNGFEITGPVNYTCEYNSVDNTADWSHDLKNSLPECRDTETPVFSPVDTFSPVDCDQTYDLDQMQSVLFNHGTPKDNFAIASFSTTNHIQTGDVLIADTSVTYTIKDFRDNEATCTVAFNIIDRINKPSLTCPDEQTVNITDGLANTYNTSQGITVFGGELEVNPPSITYTVNDVGTAKVVTATATDQFGTQSHCTFMVHFEAGACFSELVFTDIHADRSCIGDGSSLVCMSTCRSGYIYQDGTDSKNFTCSGSGTWDYTSKPPNEIHCLLPVNPEYTVDIVVQHINDVPFISCKPQFITAVEEQLPTFESNIIKICANSVWNVNFLSTTFLGLATIATTLQLNLQSPGTSNSQRDMCISNIINTPSVFDLPSKMWNCTEDAKPLINGTFQVHDQISTGTPRLACANAAYLQINSDVLDGIVCVPYGIGQFYNTETQSVETCPTGEYQDDVAQTSCKTCADGSYPNADQTGCQPTCPRGFTSATGFYPCSPCAVDRYWTAKDTCTPCPSDSKTVGFEGSDGMDKCYAPCHAGTYSQTGYNILLTGGCKQCPLHFYQADTGTTHCNECTADSTTTATGTIHSDNCTSITDVCDGTYCSGSGNCSFEFHKRVCDCDPGYHGLKCQSMYHECDGNPCTNGATCIPGLSPTNYTCSCRTDLDKKCEMTVINTTHVVDVNLLGSLQIKQMVVLSVEQCKNECITENNCKEASYMVFSSTKYCLLLKRQLSINEMQLATSEEDVHLQKICDDAFGGTNCEHDMTNDCVGATCHENSQCMDKINDFKCICPSAGGYTGELCAITYSPCNGNPCGNHGICTAHGTVRYECTCEAGYNGLQCDINIDECSLHPDACLYDGSCNDEVNSYSCICKTGFSGLHCQITQNLCDGHDCNGENLCYSSLDRMEGVCVCDLYLFTPLYRCAMNVVTGETSEMLSVNLVGEPKISSSEDSCSDLCEDTTGCFVAIYAPISEGSTIYACAMYNSNFTPVQDNTSVAIYKNCTNHPAEAYACDRTKMPCDRLDCNNGTCMNTNNDLLAICDCQEGFTGSHCQHSRDDCIANQCENEATCMDGHLGYTCDCPPGYDGDKCENNVEDCPGSCNTTHGTCVDKVNGYDCECSNGYDGDNCETEINECGRYPCQHGGTCTDIVNGFTCNCSSGWEGDHCDKWVDNCEGIRRCENEGTCYSLEKTSFCRCEGGTVGENCENATLACDTLSGIELCINEGVCVNKAGTAVCSCPEVHDVDRCYFEEGLEDTFGGVSPNGEISSGLTITECKSLCLKSKFCAGMSYVVLESGSYCSYYTAAEVSLTPTPNYIHFERICPTDYAGVSCEFVKDWCSANPCNHDGICIHIDPTGFECNCQPGYSGPTCEVAADPCDSYPCIGQAMCKSSATDYICQCVGGSVWTGTSCKPTDKNYVMLVNSASGQEPPHLKTAFPLTTNELSIMMFTRVHYISDAVTFPSLFALFASSDLDVTPSADNKFSLIVNKSGIHATFGMSVTTIPFSNDFGERLHDGQLHHLGIVINSGGMMSASIDALFSDPVDIGHNVSLDLNAQVYLGYGYVVEYENVTVWDKTLQSVDFSQAAVGTFVRRFEPIQDWWNYKWTYSASYSQDRLSHLIQNPNLAVPQLNCDAAIDLQVASTERLRTIDDISQLGSIYNSVKTQSDKGYTYKHSIDAAMTWGYYSGVIVGIDDTTKHYGECRFNVYIKYNENCPAIDPPDSSVTLETCPLNTMSYCDISCDNSTHTALSAPVPNYFICGPLGVWDYIAYYKDVIVPSCTVHGLPTYSMYISMQFALHIACKDVPTSTIGDFDETIRANFLDISTEWPEICDSSANCTNLKKLSFECEPDEPILNVKYSLDLKSKVLTAAGGGAVPIVDALKIILLIEPDMLNVENIVGARLIHDSVIITMEEVCMAGHMLNRNGDTSLCVPCGLGWFLKAGVCVPCGYGSYQNEIAQTECKHCSDNQTTYMEGARHVSACKDVCDRGRYYDEDEDTCIPCQRHFYQPKLGKNFCIPCNVAYKTVTIGSYSENDCNADCPAGEERSEDIEECNMCERGYWRSLAFDDCQLCPANKTTVDGHHADVESDCTITICNLGEYFDRVSAKCLKCEYGQFQDETLMLECKQCAGNKTTRIMGAQSASDCEFYCHVGYERKGMQEVCLMCERGYYKDNTGDSKFEPCQVCPSHTTDNLGATSADNCSIPVCGTGQYISADACKECPQDSFSDDELPNSETQCVDCDELYGTMGARSTSDQCKKICPGGEQIDNTTGLCVKCLIGTFKIPEDRFGHCVSCETDYSGFVTVDEGSTAGSNCTLLDCPPGKYFDDDECMLCPVGKYQNESRQTFCYECGEHQSTNGNGKTSLDQCKIECGPGQYGTESCTLCPLGTFKNSTGYSNCEDCPPNFTSNMNRTACPVENCLPGYGYRRNQDACVACPRGMYNANEGVDPNTCKFCPSFKTNIQSGSSSCNFDAEPRVEARIDVTIVMVYRIAIDDCSETEDISLIWNEILQLLRNVFMAETVKRFDGRNKFCTVSNCGNLVLQDGVPACQLISKRKRAISHTLEIPISFKNVSESLTDQLDDDVEVSTLDILSQILLQSVEELSNATVEIIYERYRDIATVELCAAGGELVNDNCTACPVGKYGPTGDDCRSCDTNTYQNVTGQASCIPCPANTYTEGNSSTLSTDCIGICPAGYAFDSDNKACEACPIRFYKEQIGNEYSCTKCASDKTTNGAGSTSPDDCIAKPTSDTSTIITIVIGGSGALLMLILLCVGLCKYCSGDSETKMEEHIQSHSSDYISNAYDTQARPVTLYPSIKHPVLYKPDTSFEEGSFSNPYKYRQSVQVDDNKDDEPTCIWIA